MPPGYRFCAVREAWRLVVVTQGAGEVQQGREQVVDIQVQANGRHDVVGFAAIDDSTRIKKDETRHQHDNSRRDSQLQT